MLATLRKALLVAPLTILFSAASLAQTTTAFEGVVKGQDGDPLKGAVVKLTRTDIKGNYQTKTDKKGHYFYGGLPKGMYKITVEMDGKELGSMGPLPSNYGDPVQVNIDLKAQMAAGAGQAAPEKEVERGMSSKEKAEYEGKKKANEEALKKNKELNDSFNAGIAAQDAKQWDVAIQSFEKASQIDPKQNVVWGRLADSYAAAAKTKTGDEQAQLQTKAVDAYMKAIELKPDAPEYHNNYALVLAAQKKFADAQAELQKAAQLDPASAGKYYFNLGAVLVNTGQLEPASEAFKKAIEVQPNYADAYYQYGICLMGKASMGSDGKMTPVPGTVEAFQKYLELDPNGKDAETAKAMLQQIGGTIDTNYVAPGAKKQTPKKKQ
jgi:tetratricopeptide (TPR) repeat protein